MIVKDMLNREVRIPQHLRIVSLVPSQTELLFDLGLDKEVVGITNYCVHPPEWRLSKTRVKGTKNIDIQLIKSINPNLIIANKEENPKEIIEVLAKEYPVWVSDVYDYNSALSMIEQIAFITNKVNKGNQIISGIKSQFERIKKQVSKTAVYLIWNNPLMTIGGDTYISGILEKIGYINLFKKQSRYPETSLEAIKGKNPDYILLSSEPYPFQDKHLEFFKKEFPNSIIKIVDGEMYSWYGSRMLKAAKYFQKKR